MATLALTLTMLLQVATSANLQCLGFISEKPLPADVFIAASEEEGVVNYSSESELVYLNGPGLASLKAGEIYRVVRPEGTVPGRNGDYAIYYKGLGTVRIQRVDSNAVLAMVQMSCRPIMKGDLVIPLADTVPVEFNGTLSNKWTPFPPPGGLVSQIVLGKDYLHNMASGDFCFIGVGTSDGVKPGDTFTIYRLPPPFNPGDLSVAYSGHYDPKMVEMLRNRTLPPHPVGDLVVVEAGETTSAARIVNSLVEAIPGDLVIRR